MARFNATNEGVKVEGLAELRRALKAIDAAAPKELAAAGKEVAVGVADDAANIAYGLGGVAAHVAPSIAPGGTQRGGSVNFGGAAYPMAAGAEFGGQGKPTTQQFQPWRGSGSGAGYFVYPAIRQNADRIESEFRDAIDHLIRKYDL